jgi:asparaginyl-tRNA synthetase
MDTNTLSSKVAAATLALAAPKAENRSMSTGPKRMAVSKVWDSMLRGARNAVNVPSACENTDPVNHENVI